MMDNLYTHEVKLPKSLKRKQAKELQEIKKRVAFLHSMLQSATGEDRLEIKEELNKLYGPMKDL